MKAIIIGATGATGNELLKQLISAKPFSEVVALVRRPLTVKHPKLKEVIVDFNRLDDWSVYITGDVAFSCLGTTLRAAGSRKAQYVIDYNYQYRFAEIAKANKVPAFILISSSTAHPKSAIFYSRMKGALEQAVELLGFTSFIVFRPGPLLRPATDRTGEKIGVSIIAALNKIGLFKNMTPLAVEDLAALMLRYGKQLPSGHQVLESGRILKEIKRKQII